MCVTDLQFVRPAPGGRASSLTEEPAPVARITRSQEVGTSRGRHVVVCRAFDQSGTELRIFSRLLAPRRPEPAEGVLSLLAVIDGRNAEPQNGQVS